MCNEICGDERFTIIAKAKEALIESTNIETSPKEMEVLNDFLFRCWQMGWLEKYEIVRCKDCEHHFYDVGNQAWFCHEHEYGEIFNDDDFCSLAKMKGGNDD